MSARKLKGYVVRLFNGARSSQTPKPVLLTDAIVAAEAPRETWNTPPSGFAVYAMRNFDAANCFQLRYAAAIRKETDVILTREEAVDMLASLRKHECPLGREAHALYRVMPDGEHEAALAAAREEGRREGALRALATCRAQLEHWLDLWRHRARAPEYPGDEVASGAKVEAYEQAILTIGEAAKGAAK